MRGHHDQVAVLRLGMVQDRFPGVQGLDGVAVADHARGNCRIDHRLDPRRRDALLGVVELLRRHRLHFGDGAVGEGLLYADGVDRGTMQFGQRDGGLRRLGGDFGTVGRDKDALEHENLQGLLCTVPAQA
jgi:hypothetical protein